MFKFIHTADIHLDSPLRSLALRDPDAAELVTNATRQSLSAIIDMCLEEQVDALLIAGDLYDGGHHSMKTAGFLTNQLRRLDDAKIAVFIIRGNHDAISKITRQLQLPDCVHVFGPKHSTFLIEDKNVAIHGVSFAKADSPESLLPGFAAPTANMINIGMLHTSLSGATGHDDYAPCSLNDLVAQSYDYWALGHIHKREVHAKSPNFVVMPGIPQGRHINEAGPKSVTLVSVDDVGSITIEQRQTSLVQFERVVVDVNGISDRMGLLSRAEGVLANLRSDVQSTAIIVRIMLRGETSMAAKLRRDNDVLLEEFRLIGQRSGSMIIESIDLDVSEPMLETKSATGDPIGELSQIIDSADQSRLSVENQLKERLESLRSKLPPEIRDQFDGDDAAVEALLESYITEGSKDVLARLQTGESDS